MGCRDISELQWVPRVALLAGLFWVAGCGRSTPPPMPASDTTQPVETAQSGPTTQEFMAAPFVDISLRPLPLHAKVPRSWGIQQNIGGTDITLLHGPNAQGKQLHIMLLVLMSMTPDRVDLVLQAAQRDAKKDPSTLFCNVKQNTDMQVLEIQHVMTTATQPEDQPVDWKITYFVQHGVNYDSYVLSVNGLTKAEYEQSKDLLRRIIDSVTYVSSGV